MILIYSNFCHVLSSYLDNDSITKNKYEGVFELFNTENKTAKYRFGIYNQNDTLKIIYFSGADYSDDWQEGELKGILTLTKSENDFLVFIYNSLKIGTNASLSFPNSNSFLIKMNDANGYDKYVRIK